MTLRFIDPVFQRFEEEQKCFWPHEVSGAIYMAAHQNQLTSEQQLLVQIEAAPWEFHTRNGKDSCWGTYYAPFQQLSNTDGSKTTHPDIGSFGASGSEVWEDRLNSFTHPCLVARYADVLWDLAQVIVPGSRRNPDFARRAIAAYMELSNGHWFSIDIQAAQAAQRALQIATELNDSDLLRTAADQLLQLASKADLSSMGVWVLPAHAFSRNSKISIDHRNLLARELERRLSEAHQERNGNAASTSAEWLLKIYARNTGGDERIKVLQSLAETHVSASSDIDPSVSIDHLSGVVSLLEAEGMNAEAERLRLIIEDLGPRVLAGMKTHSVEVSINLEELDRELDAVIDAKHPYAALLRLALQLIPKCDQLREQVKSNERDFIFYSLFSRTIIGSDGIPKATIGSSEDDMEGRMVEEANLLMQMSPDLFSRGYEKVRQKFGFSGADLAQFLSGCSLVTETIRPLLQEGIVAFEAGDDRKAISVLIPQVEAMLRELLKLLSIPTRKSIRGQVGKSELKNLNDVLGDPRVQETLEEDLLFFLKILYVDKRSYNLRNEAMHGILAPDAFNRVTSGLVMMSIILLGVIGSHGVYISGSDDVAPGASGGLRDQ